MTERLTPYISKTHVTKLVGIAAVLVSLVTGYITTKMCGDVDRFQSEQITSFAKALGAFNSWQTSEYPTLASWVTTNPLMVAAGIPQVEASGAGTLAAWGTFAAMKLWKKKEE